jgi:putative transposase
MHALMLRQGCAIGRDQTERLMREAGVRGVRKSKRVFTTKLDLLRTLSSSLGLGFMTRRLAGRCSKVTSTL